MKKVVTYQSPSGLQQVNICPACERKLAAEKVWPHDAGGQEVCQVSHGLHFASCDVCRRGRAELNIW